MDRETAQLRELAQGMVQEVQYWRGLLALVLKSLGGEVTVRKSETDVLNPFEIVMKRTDDQSDEEDIEMQFKLLEGKEEIESVLGAPSPLIIPK